VSAEDKEVRVISTREDTTEEYSFDALAKGLASGTISRRKALKLAGAAILGGGLLAFGPTREAEAAECGNRPGCSRRCRNRRGCRCVRVRSAEGTNVRCVRPCCLNQACDTNAQCGSGELCMVTGCCPQDEQAGRLGVCVKQCPQEPRPNNCSRQQFS
jgi:hypothetical protein